MTCWNCNKENGNGNKYCAFCGAELVAQNEPVIVAQMTNGMEQPSNCAVMPQNSAEQPGIPLNNEAFYDMSNQPQAKSSSKLAKIILIVAGGVLVVVGLIITILMTMKGGIHTSPESISEAYTEAILEEDIERTFECMPDFMVRQAAASVGLYGDIDRTELAERVAGQSHGSLSEDEIVIIGSQRVFDNETDYSKVSKLRGQMTEEEFASISEMTTVEVYFKKNGNETERKVSVICMEMGNKWYAFYIDMNSYYEDIFEK